MSMDTAGAPFRLGEDRRTDVPVHAAIAGRYSTRAFAERPVAPEHLDLLLEAARWAPSAFNEQPWRFIQAVQGTPEHQVLSEALHLSNRVWASHAPVLLLALARTRLARNGEVNNYARYDLGLAVGLMTVQATLLGIGMHQMAGFDPQLVRGPFALGEELDPVVIIALGYPGEGPYLSEHLRAREHNRTTRIPRSEIVR